MPHQLSSSKDDKLNASSCVVLTDRFFPREPPFPSSPNTAGSSLRLRELFVLDQDFTNVARGRVCTTSHAVQGNWTAGKLVDMTLDWDVRGDVTDVSGVSIPAQSGSPVWVQCDLSGVVDVSTVMLFTDRYVAAAVGTRLTLLNHYGLEIGAYDVGLAGVQTFANVSASLYEPSRTP